MKNYYEIKNEASIQFDEKQSEHFVNQERELLIKIVDKDYLLCTLDCATIQYTYIDIINTIVWNQGNYYLFSIIK